MAQTLNEFVTSIDGERDMVVEFLTSTSEGWINWADTLDEPSVRDEMRTMAATAQLLAGWIAHNDHRRT